VINGEGEDTRLAIVPEHDDESKPQVNRHLPTSGAVQAPLRPLDVPETGDIKVSRRDRLGGVIHEYKQLA
jgi:hypothetical protein